MKLMNYLRKHLIAVMISFLVFCMTLLLFFVNQLSTLAVKIEGQKQSSKKISEYLESGPSAKYTNDSALQSFEKTKPVNLEVKHQFLTPEGFPVMSDTDSWNEQKLQELYNELMQNIHGDEINDVYQVFVHGEPDEYAAGTHSYEMKKIPFSFSFPALPETEIEFEHNLGSINLYNGDLNTTVESMAFVLSHEYGHHYTSQFMFNYDLGSLKDTKYSEIRSLSSNDQVRFSFKDNEDYKNNHHWYIWEIAANDYVQLMGSPTAKKVSKYYDIKDTLLNDVVNKESYSINGIPQDNFLIPFANEVNGLHEYFYSFLENGHSYPAPNHEKQPITINIEEKSSTYHLTSGQTTLVYYEFTWNKPFEDGVVYTLVYYDPDNHDLVYPVKTVYSNESAKAYMGSVNYTTSTQVHWQEDPSTEGTKVFVVTALFPDGSIYKSDPVTYRFN